MTLGGEYLLCNDDLVADRAMLTLGQASLGTGSRNSRIDDLGMTLGGDLFHTGENCIANGALRTGRMTSLGAGSGLFRNFNWGMPGCVDCFGLGCIANCAGVGLDAGVLTGSGGGDHAVIPLVAGGGDFGLRRKNNAADRAADAIRQTRFGTGRRLARNGLLGVAGRGNHFLRNKNFVADGAVLTLSLAGFRAGRLNSRIDDLGVALSLNGLTLGDFLAADGADRITGVAVLGAGGILLVDHLGERMVVLPLGIKSGILGQINSRTIRIGVASTIGRCIPVQEVVAFAGERVCVQCGIRLCIYSLCGHRAFDRVFRISVGFKGNSQLHRLFAAPNAVDIVDGVASLGVLRLDIGTVGVVQLGSGDGDSHRIIAICIILIGCGLLAGCALLNVLAGAVAGAYIRTTPGGIDSTNSRYTAVHIHLRINQVVIRAVVCLTRRICHGLKLAGTPDEVVGVPLIAVIEIDVLSVCNRQACAFGNVDLNARQQSGILIDGHISGLDIDGNVVGDGQHIACRVNAHACKL